MSAEVQSVVPDTISTERLEASSVPLLRTSIGLTGEAASEELGTEGKRLVVRDAEGASRRAWPMAQIESLRVETAVGSCFLQALVGGRWTDVLRCPGDVQPEMAALVDGFAASGAFQQHEAWADSSAPRRLSEWFSARKPQGEKANPWSYLARVLAIFRPFRASALWLLGLSLAAVAMDVAPPLLQRYLVDDVLRVSAPSRPTSHLLLLLLGIVVGLLIFRGVAALLGIWKGAIGSRVGTSLTAELRDQLVRKLNQLPLAFHDRSQVGMLMSRVAYDTEHLHTLLYHMTSGLLLQIFQMAGICVALFYLNPKLALLTMLPMPLIAAGSWYFTRYLNPRNQHYWDAVGKQASALTGMLTGIRVVKAFVQEDRETGRFQESSRRLRDSRQTVDVSGTTFSALIGFVFALGGLAVWYVGGRDVLFGRMSFGSLMAFLTYLAMFYAPLTSVSESASWLSSFTMATRRIFALLDTPSEEQAAEHNDPAPPAGGRVLPAPPAGGRVEFRDVSFGYDKNRPVLRDIAFAIDPGQVVGIVGRSGSGKSTLISLIGRLYTADAGEILVDGSDVRHIDARQLRRRIGMVPQEPFLFRGSLADNISYGNAQAAPEEILRAAKQADAHDFIVRRPLGYHSQVGEGGAGLSGGQRQRVSIARALLFDPAILILDEATASVDAESEQAICRAIRRFARQRTTIIIAHRLSTVRDADRLLVFDEGRLVEQGSPDELLARDGLYRTLCRIQGTLSESRRQMESVLGRSLPGDAAADGQSQWLLDTGDHSDGRPAPGGPPGADANGGELVWLDPATVCIEADAAEALCVSDASGRRRGVTAVRAFPGTHEEEYLSLRRQEPSGHESEVGLIRRLSDWPAAAAAAVRRTLGRRYFLQSIQEVRQIWTQGNELTFAVLTASGPARFRLDRLTESCQVFGKTGLLLCDKQGRYFVIPDRGALPRRQQHLLSLYFTD